MNYNYPYFMDEEIKVQRLMTEESKVGTPVLEQQTALCSPGLFRENKHRQALRTRPCC